MGRLHDTAARPRLLGALTALVVLWPLFQAAEVRPGALFDAGNLKVIAAVDDAGTVRTGEGQMIVTIQRWNNPPIP